MIGSSRLQVIIDTGNGVLNGSPAVMKKLLYERSYTDVQRRATRYRYCSIINVGETQFRKAFLNVSNPNLEMRNNDFKFRGRIALSVLYANHVGGNDIIMWHKKAADQGFTNSMVKLARAYLKRLPSNLEFNPNEAERYYRLAIKVSKDPHAQYGLAEMILYGLVKIETNSMMEILKIVINLLEESAKGGDVFAMFNLGIAHLYGYTGIVDMELAKDWFIYSNLPEGLYVGSLYYLEKDSKISNNLRERAKRLGFGTKWRQEARQHTGLGGAGGIDINLPWPEMPNGTKPERW